MHPIQTPDNCHLVERWLPDEEADSLMDRLCSDIPWQQNSVTIRGRVIPMPRMTWYCGDRDYTYSGHTHPALDWPDPIRRVGRRIEQMAEQLGIETGFNAVLMNFYRDGSDSIGWHSDSEPILGRDPVVASLSLGHQRVFRMRSKADRQRILEIPLGHGDLFLMAGSTQHEWMHAIHRTKRPVGPRINLTFRRLVG